MEATEYFATLKQELIGRRITFTRLAGNSLILYIDCKPGDKSGYTIWLEPTWHVMGTAAVLLGSRQAQTEDEMEHERLGNLLRQLHGKAIAAISYGALTYDLEVQAGDYTARTFVADPTDSETWHIHDIANHSKLFGSAQGLEIADSPAQTASVHAV